LLCGDLHGFPVVEVLKNGGPIHRYDSHFRFGRRKAGIIVACAQILRDFGWSTDDERLHFQPLIVVDETRHLEVRVSVEMNPDFEHSTGATINRPWLYLSAVGYDDIHIGLGVAKCRALWMVREELSAWVEGQSGPAMARRLSA